MTRLISGDGYWMITPPKKYKGKTYIGGRYVYEHRLLMEQKIGRLLTKQEHVDHINRNRLDNQIENLQILDPVMHGKKDAVWGQPNVVCLNCKKGFHIRPSYLKRIKHNIFCKRECYREYVQINNWGRRKIIPT